MSKSSKQIMKQSSSHSVEQMFQSPSKRTDITQIHLELQHEGAQNENRVLTPTRVRILVLSPAPRSSNNFQRSNSDGNANISPPSRNKRFQDVALKKQDENKENVVSRDSPARKKVKPTKFDNKQLPLTPKATNEVTKMKPPPTYEDYVLGSLRNCVGELERRNVAVGLGSNPQQIMRPMFNERNGHIMLDHIGTTNNRTRVSTNHRKVQQTSRYKQPHGRINSESDHSFQNNSLSQFFSHSTLQLASSSELPLLHNDNLRLNFQQQTTLDVRNSEQYVNKSRRRNPNNQNNNYQNNNNNSNNYQNNDNNNNNNNSNMNHSIQNFNILNNNNNIIDTILNNIGNNNTVMICDLSNLNNEVVTPNDFSAWNDERGFLMCGLNKSDVTFYGLNDDELFICDLSNGNNNNLERESMLGNININNEYPLPPLINNNNTNNMVLFNHNHNILCDADICPLTRSLLCPCLDRISSNHPQIINNNNNNNGFINFQQQQQHSRDRINQRTPRNQRARQHEHLPQMQQLNVLPNYNNNPCQDHSSLPIPSSLSHNNPSFNIRTSTPYFNQNVSADNNQRINFRRYLMLPPSPPILTAAQTSLPPPPPPPSLIAPPSFPRASYNILPPNSNTQVNNEVQLAIPPINNQQPPFRSTNPFIQETLNFQLPDEMIMLQDPVDSENYNALLGLARQLARTKPKGLTRTEINHMMAYHYKVDLDVQQLQQQQDKQTHCVVCMSEFEVRQRIRILPCNHHFHSKCVDKWLKTNSTCPICRNDCNSNKQPRQIIT